MIEILVNNLRWRLVEWLSRPDYIHLDINHFYDSINRVVLTRKRYIGEVRYLR